MPPNDDQEMDAKFQKNKRTKSQKQQEAEERKLRAKESKRAKVCRSTYPSWTQRT